MNEFIFLSQSKIPGPSQLTIIIHMFDAMSHKSRVYDNNSIKPFLFFKAFFSFWQTDILKQ